jgi:hypothetical protein
LCGLCLLEGTLFVLQDLQFCGVFPMVIVHISENHQVHCLQLNVERVINMNLNWQTLRHEVHMRVIGTHLLILFLLFWQLV